MERPPNIRIPHPDIDNIKEKKADLQERIIVLGKKLDILRKTRSRYSDELTPLREEFNRVRYKKDRTPADARREIATGDRINKIISFFTRFPDEIAVLDDELQAARQTIEEYNALLRKGGTRRRRRRGTRKSK
jgi:hypothetical protein